MENKNVLKGDIYTLDLIFNFLNDEDYYTENELGESCINVNTLKLFFDVIGGYFPDDKKELIKYFKLKNKDI